uniref:ABC3 transporter permease C-terminal domain-containing protein n=1 Tax=Arcella intermedia TaxID=1963864 RepID=A0A6B2KXH2_9EUKA
MNYCLGFSACFLVVFVVSVLVTILSKSPLIFMRLSELDNGELDVMIRPDTSKYGALNYTQFQREDLPSNYRSSTPRRVHDTSVYFSTDCPDQEPLALDWKYHPNNDTDICGWFRMSCFEKHCTSTHYSLTVIMMDSLREKEMLLGRDWMLPPLNRGEVYVSSGVVESAKAQVGDYVYYPFDLRSVDELVWKNLTLNNIWLDSNVYVPMKIVGTYPISLGKYGSSTPNAMLIEYDHFMDYLIEHLDRTFNTTEKTVLHSLDLKEYASMIIVNFPAPRVNAYLDSNYDNIQQNVLSFANELFFKIGFTEIVTDLPVLNGLRKTKIISLFLGLILSIITFILLFLSVLLIYSLLMINVETRTFELGVMRMTGTSRVGVVMLLLVQAFSYAVPSWMLGLFSGQMVTFLLSDILSRYVGIPFEANLSGMGVFWGTLLGIAVPIFSSILPIMDALGKNLHDALDTRKSKTMAVKIKLERADPTKSISIQVVVIGGGLALFGAMIYYIFPLALLSMNIGLLLNLFFFLLIGMLLGLTVLSLNMQPILERLVLKMFFFWENKAIQSITAKNLIAHRIRNRKTTIMYALSLGFIIFISVAYSLQISTFSYSIQQKNGALFKVKTAYWGYDSQSKKYYDLNPLIKDLEQTAESLSPLVASYGWSTIPLENVLFSVNRMDIQNIGGIVFFRQSGYAVSPGFFDATLTNFLTSNEKEDMEDTDLSRFLYSKNGTGSCLVSSLFKEQLHLTLNSNFALDITYKTPQDQIYSIPYRFKPAAFLDSSPGFAISPFPAILKQDLIMGLTTYFQFMNNVDSIEDTPMYIFYIKTRDGATEDEKNTISARFRETTANKNGELWDYRTSMQPFDVATQAMTYFFNITTVIAMLISFFSLMSSMFTNIYEQTKEIGVLRALGISKFWMYKIYIYEAHNHSHCYVDLFLLLDVFHVYQYL